MRSQAWTYFLISADGSTYIGATSNLRQRLRSHNSNSNKGYTKGRHWHILGAMGFTERTLAFKFEAHLKRARAKSFMWKLASIERARKLVQRYGYSIDIQDWLEYPEMYHHGANRFREIYKAQPLSALPQNWDLIHA